MYEDDWNEKKGNNSDKDKNSGTKNLRQDKGFAQFLKRLGKKEYAGSCDARKNIPIPQILIKKSFFFLIKYVFKNFIT